jgi:2-phospho-L-lactate/phosphoenolpyruvate guanylyltransferase
LKAVVIIPVKTFSNSKTRLHLSEKKTNELCKLLLEEVIMTISKSKLINKIIVVTNEEQVSDIIKKYDCKKIQDSNEISVNNAVGLAEKYLLENNFTHSIVLPLDIPFFYYEDLEKLLNFSSEKSVLIVPSRRFDGTNALLRIPINSMKPRYDEGSHKFQIDSAKNENIKISIVLIQRLMLDLDNIEDIEYALKQNIKPDLCARIKKIIE